MTLKTAVAVVKYRPCFDKLSTNGICRIHPNGEESVRPEQPAERACRRVAHLPTAVFRIMAFAGGGKAPHLDRSFRRERRIVCCDRGNVENTWPTFQNGISKSAFSVFALSAEAAFGAQARWQLTNFEGSRLEVRSIRGSRVTSYH